MIQENIQNNKNFEKIDAVFSILIYIISFCIMRYAVSNITGFFTTLVFIALNSSSIIYLKHNKCRFSLINILISITIFIFSFVFSITDNDFIKTLNLFFIFFAETYFVYSVSKNNKSIERFLPLIISKIILGYPFDNFCKIFNALKMSNKKINSNFLMIALGLIIAIPITSVVGSLLISADSGLENIINSILDYINMQNLWLIFPQMLFAVPISCYIFGMLYSGATKKDPAHPEIFSAQMQSFRHIPNMILYSAITPICILYLLFFISQGNYFLSAFNGTLPKDFSYSEYARQGFFELFIITLINLFIIIIINIMSSKSGENKPFALKLYTVILSFSTIVLISTALSKMALYINYYGLTRLRIYTIWFMAFIFIIFLLIIIKQFYFNFKIAQYIVITFTLFFAFLCFSKPDAIIAEHNIKMYKYGVLSELDKSTLLGLSDDGWEVMIKENVLISDDWLTQKIAKRKLEQYKEEPFKKHNISSIYVSQYLQEK